MTPEFSLIVPVYNTEKYVEKCIDSILGQSFQGFELILVDDGSPDRAGEICDSYAQKDRRIRVIHKENGGVSSARNCAIDVAQGEYIWFIDSDDYIKENALELLHRMHSNFELCVFNFSGARESFSGSYDDFLQKYYFTYAIGFEVWNKLYESELIRKNNLYFDERETIGEDLLFNIEYYSLMYTERGNVSFKSLNEDIYVYTDRDDSAMNTFSTNRLLQQLRVFVKIEDTTKELIIYKNLLYIFWLHLISGINQAKMAGLTINSFSDVLNKKDYKRYINDFNLIKDDFYNNEKASILGRIRLNLFSIFLKKRMYKLAGCIIGLK